MTLLRNNSQSAVETLVDNCKVQMAAHERLVERGTKRREANIDQQASQLRVLKKVIDNVTLSKNGTDEQK